jgi:hypothetical protein
MLGKCRGIVTQLRMIGERPPWQVDHREIRQRRKGTATGEGLACQRGQPGNRLLMHSIGVEVGEGTDNLSRPSARGLDPRSRAGGGSPEGYVA